MTDDEIRSLVRAGLSDRRLQRQSPVIAPLTIPGGRTQHLMEGGSQRSDPCLVCGGQPTDIWYPGAAIAFHARCHEVWQEEIAKLLRLS